METNASSLVAQAKEWATNYGDFPNGLEGTILTATLRVRGGWERNDADIIADAFTDNGSMLLGDEQLKGREAIRSYLADAFSAGFQGTKIHDDPAEIKVLGENVGLVISKGGLLSSGETSVPPDRENRNTWVVVKQQGEWRLLSYQSSPIKG
jgi:uncharacterized protein (TIGR02246 family)